MPNMFGAMAGAGNAMGRMNPAQGMMRRPQPPQKGIGPSPNGNAFGRMAQAGLQAGNSMMGGMQKPSLGGGDPMNQKLAPLPQMGQALGPQAQGQAFGRMGQLGQAINPQLNQMMNQRNQALGMMGQGPNQNALANTAQAAYGLANRPPQMQEGGQMANQLGLQPMQQSPEDQEMMKNRIQEMMQQRMQAQGPPMGQQGPPMGIGPSAPPAPMQQAMPQRRLFGRR